MSTTTDHLVERPDDCWNRIGVWSRDGASCPRLESVVHCRNCDHFSRTGRQLLERPIPEDYRREWGERLADRGRETEADSQSVLVFRLGDEWLALDATCVVEITPFCQIHSLPHTRSHLVKGLVNIRGELRLCLSLGGLLEVEKARGDHVIDHEIHERMVCIRRNGEEFVFPVSEIAGIHHYAAPDLQAVPVTVSRARSSFTTGIIEQDDRRIGILEPELLFYALGKTLG
ncbi:MAG TPA: purine-binding chemotaxis protein CheW [Gammaproteobacteria bacterium]|nr:purine-binding chemotaxis protein CheW [Gammaproteobacteria bacterium]